MKKSISKKEAEKQIEEFFHHIRDKDPSEVKKIKKLAMSYSIKLGEKRKTFCKKCLHPYIDPSIRIKSGKISLTCEFCDTTSGWKFDENHLPPISGDHEEECDC